LRELPALASQPTKLGQAFNPNSELKPLSWQKSRFLLGRGHSARIAFAPDWITRCGDQSIENVADRRGTDVPEPPQPTESRQFVEDVENSVAPQEQLFPLGVPSKNEDRVHIHCLRMVQGYSLECFSLQRREEKASFAVFAENKIDSSVTQPAHPVEEDYGLFDH
jgi:hypothetical protein